MLRIPLLRQAFGARELTLLQADDLAVSSFLYRSGIEGLRIVAPRMELEILPYHGQQIWRMRIDGADVGMRGMTDEPTGKDSLLDTFGAFFFHCGLIGTAQPGMEDDHPIHGELPLAAIDDVCLRVDHISGGTRLRVEGSYEHARAFTAHYRAEPSITLTSGRTDIEVAMRVTNLMGSPFQFAYLAHPNFRPVDGARLHYSAPYDADHVRLRDGMPSHFTENPAFSQLLKRFAEDPVAHHQISPGVYINPEAVFLVDYLADEEGWAHTLQVHPDGAADWVAHRPAECPRAARWLSRTPEHDAIAIVEPSTSWLGGRSAEKQAGRLAALAPGGVWTTRMRIGRLDHETAARMIAHADRVAGRNEQQGR